ncbi:MAG TPA: vitamin K epoxide reductase family protein [Pyrinomonadaceae bacterium]|nr:vitamin K epoxide reductase family protein [Pyrinomonadaceae bacterium]
MSKPYMADEAAPARGASAAQAAKRAGLLYGLAAVVALIGIGDTIYLTVEHLSGRSAQCVVTSGCSRVLSSPYASPAGIPLAVIGAAAYFTIFSLATLAAFGYRQAGRLFSILVAMMFLTTLVLLYLQAFVIREFCDYCLLSALLVLILTIITSVLWRLQARA